VAGDDPLLTLGVDDDLDGAGKDDVEIIAGVALPVEVLTGRDRSRTPSCPNVASSASLSLLKATGLAATERSHMTLFRLLPRARDVSSRDSFQRRP